MAWENNLFELYEKLGLEIHKDVDLSEIIEKTFNNLGIHEYNVVSERRDNFESEIHYKVKIPSIFLRGNDSIQLYDTPGIVELICKNYRYLNQESVISPYLQEDDSWIIETHKIVNRFDCSFIESVLLESDGPWPLDIAE